MKSRDSPHKGEVHTKGQVKEKLQRPKVTVAVKMVCGRCKLSKKCNGCQFDAELVSTMSILNSI